MLVVLQIVRRLSEISFYFLVSHKTQNRYPAVNGEKSVCCETHTVVSDGRCPFSFFC